MHRRKFYALLLAVLLLAGCTGGPDPGVPEETPPPSTVGDTSPVELTAMAQVVIEGFEWGPGVTKIILTLNHTVAAVTVNADSFAVAEVKEAYNMANPKVHGTAREDRLVKNAYTCDDRGNPTGDSDRIALELACSPTEGSPFCYDMLTGRNTFCNPYTLEVTLTDYAMLEKPDGTLILGLSAQCPVDLKQAIYPQLEKVDLSGTFTGTDGRVLTYASYAPEQDGQKHPLVIWLHGGGEGGTDPAVAVLGNEVTALYSREFQATLGGAYVLAPQTPSRWLDFGGEDGRENPGASSVYHNTLMELIEDYVNRNPDIDRNRIYVGGCSNGGFMTMDLIMNHPDYFAAAFPICQAYPDAGITDEQLAAIRQVPLWFVYAANDNVVDPQLHTVPTLARLRALDADVHESVFADIHDTSGRFFYSDGSPLQYSGHWSWVYFFNNLCEENGVTLWTWLAQQSRG